MIQDLDVVIIGAGITGLTTSYYLNKSGLKICLLESSKRVGGVIHTNKVDHYLLEYGPNSFQESDEINNLINELNLGSELVTADPKMPRYVYFQGKLQTVPLSPPALVSSSLISLSGKLRIFAEPFISKYKQPQEESIASFVRRRLGTQIHDRLVSPFVSGVYAGNTENLSLAASFPTLAKLEQDYGSLILGAIKSRANKSSKPTEEKKLAKRLCSFKEGLSTLPCALSNHLKDLVKLDSKILSLTINQQKPYYKIKFEHNGSFNEISTNHLVLATPATVSASLLENHLPIIANELKAIEYVPIAIVHLSFPLSKLNQPLNGFGVLIPRSEKIRLLGSIWNSSLFPERAPKDEALLTNFIGGAHDPNAILLTDSELGNIIGAELKTILNIAITPKIINIYRYQKAIPQYTIGHLTRLAKIEAELNKQSGLYLASNYLQGVSVPDCISRGLSLSQKIKQFFAS